MRRRPTYIARFVREHTVSPNTPPRRFNRTGAPNMADKVPEVRVSARGPEATTRPARNKSAWVKAGVISST